MAKDGKTGRRGSPPKGNRPAPIEIQRRVDAADALLRGGKTRGEVVRALQTQFRIATRSADRAIATARKRWASEGADDREAAHGAEASAELSERNSNYAVAHPGTTARDILQLVDHVRTKVKERTGVSLERELHVW